mgnify:FL=1
MPTGGAWRFDNSDDSDNLGSAGDANLNSLDAGMNVYKTPGQALQFSVAAGKYVRFSAGAIEEVSFAGVSGQALTGGVTTYIWMSSAGTIATSNSAFPAHGYNAEHIRLATIVTSASAITSITDNRPRMSLLGHAYPRAPSATVLALTGTAPTGAQRPLAFASDGRKVGEGGGAGTGTVVYWDGVAWRRVGDDTTVVS